MTAVIYAVVIILLVAADQIVKQVVVANMELNQTIEAIDGLLNWTYILNNGASWGIFSGETVFLVVVTLAVMGFMGYLLFTGRLGHILGDIAVTLIIAGGVGNCIDRIFNNGYVVDYIDISPIFSFPKFNIADCCITCGGVLLCVYILFFFENNKGFFGKKQEAAENEQI